jgi:hypothetical protein
MNDETFVSIIYCQLHKELFFFFGKKPPLQVIMELVALNKNTHFTVGII